MAEPQITFNGDATSMLKAYQQMDAARKREAEGLRELKKEYESAAKSERDAAREGEQIKQRNLTAQEKYTASITRLKELLDKGKITQQDYNRELDRQNQLLKETEAAADTTGNRLTGLGKDLASSLLGVGSAIGVVMAVSGALKAAWEDMKRRQQESLTAQLSFGDAIRAIAVNLPADEFAKPGEIEDRIKLASSRTLATPETVAQAASSAMSAKGAQSAEAAMRAVEQALKINPNDAIGAATLAGRSLDIVNMGAGVTDTRAAMQMLLQMQATARVKDIDKLGKAFMPSIVTGTMRGDTLEQASERLIQLNNLMKDQEGSTSATAYTNLVNRLAKFAPGDGTVPDVASRAFAAAKSTDERIGVMAANPELRRAFLATNSFEAASQAAIEQILGGESEMLGVSRRGISMPTVSGFDAFINRVNAMPSQKRTNIARKSKANITDYELGDEGSADAQARAIMEDTYGKLGAMGPGWLQKTAVEARGLVIGLPEAALEDMEVMQRPGQLPFASAEQLDLLKQQTELMRELVRQANGSPPEAALGKK